jgi:hypothetical protein
MHPADFVSAMIAEGKVDQLIEMIRNFRSKLDDSKTSDHAVVYRFSTTFLIAVVGQLHCLSPGQDFHNDPLLAVWADLGYFGILRDQIPDDSEE